MTTLAKIEANQRNGQYSTGPQTAEGKAVVARNATTPELVRLFTVLVGEAVADTHPAHAFFAGRYAELRTRIAAAVAQGQESGEFAATVDGARVAALVLAVMDGLQIQWLLDGDQDMARTYDFFESVLLTHLGGGGVDRR